jgi:GPN-loop GTPase
VSSLTGAGMDDFFKAAAEKKQEYEKEYKPELERRIRERAEEKKTEGLDKLMQDMKVGSSSGAPARKPVHLETISDGEDDDEDDGFLVDPDRVDDEGETLQEKFVAARNAQVSAEDAEFDRWATEVNRGGM